MVGCSGSMRSGYWTRFSRGTRPSAYRDSGPASKLSKLEPNPEEFLLRRAIALSRSHLFLTLASLALCATLQAQDPSDRCTAAPLPPEISGYLKATYPSWRIKQPSDFRPASDPYSQRANFLCFTQRRCPGIAVGKFQPGSGLTYAFLLVPATPRVRGFQLVTLIQQGSKITSQVVASPPEWEDVDWMIRSVKLAPYGAAGWSRRPERAGAGICGRRAIILA